MNIDQFWEIIDDVSQRARPQDEQDVLLETMKALQKLSDEELVRWHDIQHAYSLLADTPGMVRAAAIINNGTSDDRFMDFRAWLIAQGKAVYEAALLDPDSLASVDVATEKGEWEFYGYIASFSYDYRLIQEKLQQNGLPQRWKGQHPTLDVHSIQDEIVCSSLLGRYYPPRISQDKETLALAEEIKDHVKALRIRRRYYPVYRKLSAGYESAVEDAKRALSFPYPATFPGPVSWSDLPKLFARHDDPDEYGEAVRPRSTNSAPER